MANWAPRGGREREVGYPVGMWGARQSRAVENRENWGALNSFAFQPLVFLVVAALGLGLEGSNAALAQIAGARGGLHGFYLEKVGGAGLQVA